MKRLLLTLFVLALTTVIAHAADKTIAGVVTKVDPNMIEVRTDKKETVSVIVNATTAYRKWIMAKPWGQDPTAHASNVKVGMRVRIDVAKDNPQTAKTVWIVVGRPGYPDAD